MSVPETFFSVSEELRLLGYSCLLGAAMGVVYDVFRTLRILFTHNSLLTAIEDVVFLMLCGTALLSFASAAARGELRFYFVIGSAVGFTLYILTLGNIVRAVMQKLLALLKAAAEVVLLPFKRVYAFLRKKTGAKFVGSSKLIVNSIKKIKSLLLKRRVLLYNRMENKKKERGRHWQKGLKEK